MGNDPYLPILYYTNTLFNDLLLGAAGCSLTSVFIRRLWVSAIYDRFGTTGVGNGSKIAFTNNHTLRV